MKYKNCDFVTISFTSKSNSLDARFIKMFLYEFVITTIMKNFLIIKIAYKFITD